MRGGMGVVLHCTTFVGAAIISRPYKSMKRMVITHRP